jgi:hypothetical protein
MHPKVAPSRFGRNGTAERWVGNCKRELIDHVVVLGEDPLRRLPRDYVTYYNTDRVHTRLADAPEGRSVEIRPERNGADGF